MANSNALSSPIIAYLAPEIPSLSGTFVYGEIFALQRQNITIIPFSIHRKIPAQPDALLQQLAEQTYFLYERSLGTVFQDNLHNFLRHPLRYLRVFFRTLGDMIKVGLFNTSAVKLFYQFLQGNALARQLIEKRCQHLHIHFASVPTQVGMYGAQFAQIPFSFTSHANDLFERGGLLPEKLARCQFAVTISDYNDQFLQQRSPLAHKVKVIHCGVNLEDFSFQQKQTWQQPILIKSLGRFVEKKGFDTLILAASRLQQQGMEFRLEIGGDGPEKAQLQHLITEHQLTSVITLVGSLPHPQVLPWLREADLFVLACKVDQQGDQDGIPVVLMEAMAAGIPVISTALSGIPELIEDGVTGFLAQPNDVSSLAMTLETAFQSGEKIAQITQAARLKIEQDFNLEKNAQRLLELITNPATP